MLKERVIQKVCSAVHQEVTLEVASSENDVTGYESPGMIRACESARKCGVETESGMHWERCVFYGKTF